MDSGAEQVAERTTPGVPYLLVTDTDGRPLGWTEPKNAVGGGAKLTRNELISHGRPFEFGRESLRDALDCAVLSPTGWAVAVDGDGRVVGVTSQESIAAAIRGAHAEREAGASLAKGSGSSGNAAKSPGGKGAKGPGGKGSGGRDRVTR